MNKLVKGAIAGAAGIALLLGGAGTFALWNSSANVNGGTIVAGNLHLGTATTGSWTVAHIGTNGTYGTAVTVTDLSKFKASPGDQLTYTSEVPVTATGDNLVAAVSLSPGSIVATPTSATHTKVPADDELARFLTANTTVSMTGSGITGTAPNYVLTAGSGAGISTTATVTATITFASGAAGAENTAMLGSVDLSGMSLTVTQK
ncbi:MAG: hypothetical protein JWM49_423 [Microbacteriaceae bacterium]|jgi:alternate signal-mediated exported protein|nr:hypothetical protein [Microbacteriaceae bacterium]